MPLAAPAPDEAAARPDLGRLIQEHASAARSLSSLRQVYADEKAKARSLGSAVAIDAMFEGRVRELEQKASNLRRFVLEVARNNPTYSQHYQRGAEQRAVDVTLVPHCGLALDLWDSKYKYAGTQGFDIVISLPLFRALDEKGRLMAAAHELSAIVSGYNQVEAQRPAGMATNRELNQPSLDTDTLTEIDKLTVMLLEPFGLTPLDFRAFLEARAADKSGFFEIEYSSSQFIKERRLDALTDIHERRKAGKPWPQPEHLSKEKFRALLKHLADAKSKGLVQPFAPTPAPAPATPSTP